MEELGLEYEDVGVNEAGDETMYPSVAEEVCRRIIESGYEKEGILVCGTGIGMAITANKFPGSMPRCAMTTIPPSGLDSATTPT